MLGSLRQEFEIPPNCTIEGVALKKHPAYKKLSGHYRYHYNSWHGRAYDLFWSMLKRDGPKPDRYLVMIEQLAQSLAIETTDDQEFNNLLKYPPGLPGQLDSPYAEDCRICFAYIVIRNGKRREK